MAPSLKPSTLDFYTRCLGRHILPLFGAVRVRRIRRGQIKGLLAEKLKSGLARDSVRLIHATLRVVLNAAMVDDELILSNPAQGLSRTLRLVRSTAARQEEIKAFDRDQLARLLAVAASEDPNLLPLLMTLARTGVRMGEALALQWDDVDLERREVRVSRALSFGRIETPKSGHGRTVDMSAQLASVLRAHQARARAEGMASGAPDIPWVFLSEAGTLLDIHNVTKRFRRLLKKAGLPLHFHLHCLRHTFASLLLADGASPAYVQEQLGHASVELTVGTYGRWLRKKAPGAVDRLDDAPRREQVVANRVESGSKRPFDLDDLSSDLLLAQSLKVGDPPWTRTMNPEIKSLLLYQLS